MSVTWTKNGDNKYLVESAQHLLQIMHQGSLYTNLGDYPTDFWGSSYLQSSDIDLANDHASIAPIGNDTTRFTGEYDGSLFDIKNWSYTTNSPHVGLFGYCHDGAVLTHIRLSGVWVSSGGTHAGFVCGYFSDSNMYDIECDFTTATSLTGDGSSSNCGALVGYTTQSALHGTSVRGVVELGSSTDGYTGGLVGNANDGTTMTVCRNMASFPNGIGGTICGGIVGYSQNIALSSCLNGMTGDIVAESVAGGIIGRAYYGTQLDAAANSMTGDITSPTIGGVVGSVFVSSGYNLSASKLLNYMRGDLVAATDSCGGILGSMYSYVATTITESVVAMQGTVTKAVSSTFGGSAPTLDVSVDTSFGMVFGENDYGTATMVVDDALVYHSEFTDLPYFDLGGTDPAGNAYAWDFLYANLGAKYDRYTDLSVHKAQVSAPFYADFGLGESNSVAYATFANTDENSLYINSGLTVVGTTADVAFDHDKSAVLYGTPDPPTTVLWTKNGDNKYLVESAQHLLQIMHQGSLYTNLGDYPTDFWGSSYLQSSDVDLENDHASIAPIGNDTTRFTGEYDGSLFEIKNWSYTTNSAHVGLFGYCHDGAVLTHIRLSGVWVSSGGTHAGFVCGYFSDSNMYDIECDFTTATSLTGDGSSSNCGALVGYATQSALHGTSVRGVVELGSSTDGYTGGLVGNANDGTTMTVCRNMASFPNGIGGTICGGIVGYSQNIALSSCLNGMTGDIVAESVAGGIIGQAYHGTQLDAAANSMTGDITSPTIGGVVGSVFVSSGYNLSASKLLNYMRGDLVAATDSCGGILGSMYSYVATTTITESVVAMQGTVTKAVSSTFGGSAPTLDVSVDTSFGMVFGENDYGTATMVVDDALVYHSEFTDLPYFDLGGTDPAGNAYAWDFLYANLGAKYDHYTHLSVHKAQVSAPFYADFGLGESNSVAYATFANTDDNSLYINSGLTVVETTANVAFDHDQSAVMYGTPDPSTTNSAESYDVADFYVDEAGLYDITSIADQVSATVVNDLFTTGDTLAVDMKFARPTVLETTFVKEGETLDVNGVDAVLLPFELSTTSTQESTILLSDETSVTVSLEQGSEEISLGGTNYASGQSFIIDGRKCTVFDI